MRLFEKVALAAGLLGGLVLTAQAQQPAIRLLTSSSGWVSAGNHLLWTSTAGLAWTDITPYSSGETALAGVFFLDTAHGWVLRSGTGGQLETARTSDGGITWTAAPLALPPEDLTAFSGRAALDFIDPSHGWAMLRRMSSSGFSLGMLFSTSDGGATWTRLPAPPLGDPVRFISATDGWLAGGPRGDQLYVTRDGGHSWQPVTLTRPAGLHAGARVQYRLPAFDNSRDGVIAASYTWSEGAAVALYQTHDSGLTWEAQGISQRAASPNPPAIALRDSHLTLVSSDGKGGILTETDGQAVSTGDHTVSPGANVVAADFAALAQGWILTSEGHCQTYKSGCTQEQRLLATGDGGATYRDISPAMLTQTGMAAPVNGAGEGFDLCSPTTSQLQTWFNSSPYQYVNIYLGGVNAACPQPGLSQSWINQVLGQGWGLIPTWVGLQAPCSSCTSCSTFSSNTGTAASQGTSEAQSAASTMSSIGLSGSVIYYDLEYYNATSSCSAAASAFVNAWVQELHTLGYTAGVYGSPTNANSDWLNITYSPDAVWLALWNGVASVWNLSPVPNTAWANHQRIHQYTGGVNQTYGGVTLNIDQDYLDGPVASNASGFSISASPSALTIAPGGMATSTISTAISGGFNSAIALSASGLPSGVTAGFNPSSIAAPGAGSSTLTLTVSSSAAAGAYSVTVTGSGGGVTRTTTISLTITSSGGGGELMVDGGFESATSSGLTAPGWTATSNISGENVIIYHGSYPHSGSNYAYEGSNNNQNDTLTQAVSIPSNATSASLTFWVNIVTQETNTTTPYDFLYMEIHNSSGTLLATPLTLNDLNSTSSNNTNGVYFQPAPIDLSSYAGQVIQIVFHATTDVGKPTTFRIDDVSLQVGTSGGGPTFSISASPSALAVAAGARGVSTITTMISGGFNAAIALSVSGLPAGVRTAFRPTSIAAPGAGSSKLYFLAASSTAAGTYPITVTGAGGGVTKTAAISLTITSSSGSQLIVDGGFESATASGLSAPGWIATTNIPGHAVIIYHSTYPHTGSNYAYEGAYDNDNDTLTQTVAIPSNTTSALLTFWVNIVTQETNTTTPYDFLYVEIHNSAGTLLATPMTLSDLNSTSSNNTNGVYFQPPAINLAAFKGQTIQIVFHSTTDGSKVTTFRIDDVSLVKSP
jgi:Rv2525c-like, glycoside hydrolase-like domain/Immune inhibitor A-like, MAM domain